MPAITRPRGTNDLLPAEAPLREWVLDTHARVAAAHGYDPIDTPVFEATEMYERGTGAGTDVVEKEMFSFTDRGGRQLTLRPEGTPGVLRAVLGAHLEQERRPVRVHYAGPMFRYARPQAGRYHEFWQLGIEAIGERSPALDAEVIEVAWRFYEALGVSGLSLQVNTLGDIEDRLRYRAALVEYFTPLRSRLCDDCRRRLEVNPLRLLDCKRDAGLVSDAPQIGPSLSPESQGFFTAGDRPAERRGHPLQPQSAPGARARLLRPHHLRALARVRSRAPRTRWGAAAATTGWPRCSASRPCPGSGYALGVERTLAVCREQGLGPAPRRDRVVVLGVGPDGRARRRPGGPGAAGRRRRRRARRLGAPAGPPARRRRPPGGPGRGPGGAEAAAAGAATWKDLDTGRQETAGGGRGGGRARPPPRRRVAGHGRAGPPAPATTARRLRVP